MDKDKFNKAIELNNKIEEYKDHKMALENSNIKYGGWIGYEVSASNDDGIEYYAVDCEGLLFHIYEIQKFMRDGNIEPRLMLGNSSNKHLLSDESLNKLLNMSENKNYCKTNPYE